MSDTITVTDDTPKDMITIEGEPGTIYLAHEDATVISVGIQGPAGPPGGGEGSAPVWGNITGDLSDQEDLESALSSKAPAADLEAHVSDVDNPHAVTKSQVGLAQADNTSDVDKPVSAATAAALALKASTSYVDTQDAATASTAQTNLVAHTSRSDNPHSVTKSQVGLGSVDNTSDLSKPISTAVQAALDEKVAVDELVFNVKDYGAVGDGSTDDTTSIQDAIDAAVDGGIVFVPPGTYMVDPAVSLNLTTGITLMGAGRQSILKIKPESDVLDNLVKVENADRVILQDFTVNGNRANQDASDLVAVHYGVYVSTSDDCRIDNVYTHDTTGVGIHVYNSIGTVVTNCESSGNRYHGFECEQATSCIFSNNRGHHNTRHGIFISPGEVGGTGAVGNVIDSNSFDENGSYGIALGIDAQGISIGLTKENAITNNSVIRNAEYGISIFRVDDTTVTNNVVAYNGFFGIYLYRAERNQILGNRLRNNSQVSNGAYDELCLEGYNDGQGSKHNLVVNNFVHIDGDNKANYGIREATTGDGPNVIKDNYVPSTGATGRVLVQHPNTSYVLVSDTPVENVSSLRTYEDGVSIAANATLPGDSMGLDAPFGTAALRFINNYSGGNIQFVAPNGNLDVYSHGNNVFSANENRVTVHGYPIEEVADPTNDQDAATKSYVDEASTDDRERANHTGTQTASTISDFSTAADARISAAVGTTVEAYDADLASIAALTPSNDDVIQRKAGGWTNRTPSQVKSDLALTKSDVGLSNVDNTSNATERAATRTLTNARITPRVGTATSSATPTINTDNVDFYELTAQAADITSFTTNLSGTPTNGQKLWIAITGTGARAIAWGSSFEASTVALPTTTDTTTRLDVGFVWNAATGKWRCVAVA